jgi:tetratricopeptide (TPR) repeat protein
VTTKRFIIGGRTIDILGLGQPLDQAFISLHAAYFGNQALDWADFESAATQFFDANPKPSDLHNAYFNNFTIVWSSFLSSGNFDEAERVWDKALSPALKWEKAHPKERIHKGTAYYFWAMTALQRGDLDKGYALAHQAVEEDVLTSGQPVPDTPALALATLNYAKADQAFREWVVVQARFLNELQNFYSTIYSRPFTLEDFRNRFLLKPPGVDAVFLFAFALARLMRLSKLPQHALTSRFAGQLEANILFDLTLVIDAAIKAKNPNKWRFIDHAEFLTFSAKDPLPIQSLQHINSAFLSDFQATLEAAVLRTLSLPDGTPLSRLQCDVVAAYGLRNRGAHDVSSVPAIWEHFLEIEQMLMNVLFATVDYLY